MATTIEPTNPFATLAAALPDVQAALARLDIPGVAEHATHLKLADGSSVAVQARRVDGGAEVTLRVMTATVASDAAAMLPPLDRSASVSSRSTAAEDRADALTDLRRTTIAKIAAGAADDLTEQEKRTLRYMADLVDKTTMRLTPLGRKVARAIAAAAA